MTYTFDLTSGDRIELKQLFHFVGEIDLLNMMIQHKKNKIDVKLAELNLLLLNRDLDPESKEHFEDMRILYEYCDTANLSLDRIRFVPSENSIRLIAYKCSSHVSSAIDDLWHYELEIKLSDWIHRLSDYGAWRLSQ